jgi:predicted flavoprotein YhiN
MLEELPAEVTRRLLETLSADELKVARDLLGYPPGTAARYMTPNYVALRPDMTAADLAARLSRPRGKQSLAGFLRKAVQLAPPAIGLLHEAALAGGRRLADLTAAELASLINGVPLRVAGVTALDRAISTAGGVPFTALDATLMVRDRPGLYVAGEMLDWEAPTGGYLLQAAMATGVLAANGIMIQKRDRDDS